MSTPATVYDLVEFPSQPIAECHPVRMATIAALAGLTPPALERATVVDLGCGTAANLIALAAAYPGLTAIGVDPSGEAIATGRRLAEAAQLTNIELVHGTDTPLEDGQADFVIVHGVLSWVDGPTRQAVIAEAARILRSGGLAQMSYNVDPGALPRLISREIGRRVAKAELASGRADDAKAALVARLQVASRFANTGYFYGDIGAAEHQRIIGRNAQAMFHDELGADWVPLCVADLAEQALATGLDYVGELRASDRWRALVSPADADKVATQAGASAAAQQEHIDDRLRLPFHSSLFLKGSAPQWPVGVSPSPAGEVAIEDWHARAERAGDWPAQPDRDQQAVSDAIRESGAAGLSIGEIAEQAGVSIPDTLQIASRLDAYRHAVLAISGPPAAAEPGEWPQALPLARAQVLAGFARVTSLRHRNTAVSDARLRALLPLLDGTRDRAALAAALQAAGVVDDVPDVGALVEDGLAALCRSAFLVSSDRHGA